MDAKAILAGLLIGVPIGGETNAYIAYGVYQHSFGLPADALGWAMGALGILSFFSGIALMARRRTQM